MAFAQGDTGHVVVLEVKTGQRVGQVTRDSSCSCDQVRDWRGGRSQARHDRVGQLAVGRLAYALAGALHRDWSGNRWLLGEADSRLRTALDVKLQPEHTPAYL